MSSSNHRLIVRVMVMCVCLTLIIGCMYTCYGGVCMVLYSVIVLHWTCVGPSVARHDALESIIIYIIIYIHVI